uniref:Uncharacterized protein n=1 Tax=Culex tarsalis TaxID=7177 RepID=A0A1Q3EYP4_CULTA
MEDEYDIYGDLEGFEEAAAQDNKVVQELNAQIAELREQIAKKEHEKQDTIARNTILLENISSLLVTAKAELKRKDAVIADIRRERDNVAFRRKRPVKRHDQGTQTTLVRLLSREVQTEVEGEPHRIKREQQTTEWHRERKRVEDDHRRPERDRFKVKERVPVRERLGSRPVMARQEMKHAYGRRARGRTHEEERERERQARRGPRSPDAGRHPVRFRSPVRVKAEESSVPDSASDIELSRAFIPMNRKELDRYVKEIGREQSRSPVVVGGSKQDKSLEEVSGADLWDKRPRKKSKTPKKHRKQASKTPVKQKSPAIIQSDEIGTTACGSSVLSPVKSEDIEQRMSALHGHPPLPEPPELVIPPPEPPIIEQVPELPLEDEAKLNDSRELKIIESCDELGTPKGEPTVEDVRNLSAETVIERSRVEDDEDLEDGEIITPVPSPATPAKENIENAKRNAKIAIAVAQLAQETRNKLEQQEAEINSEQKVKEKSTKLKRKRADRPPQVEPNPVQAPVEVAPPAKEPTPEQDKTKHKRNLNGAFEPPTAPETSRRNTFSGTVISDKGKRRQRLSEPGSAVAAVPKVANKNTEVLHKLFGSDDDSSFVVVAPPEEQKAVAVAHGKRKRTESAGEEGMDGKKSRKVEVVGEAAKESILTEEKRSAGTDESEEVGEIRKDADESTVVDVNMVVAENESELDSKEEQQVKNAVEIEETPEDKPVTEDDNETVKSDSATSIESKDVTAESESIAAVQSAETLKSDSATSVESESSASLNRTAQSEDNEPAQNGTEVPEDKVEPDINQDVTQKEEMDESQIEKVVAANVEEDKLTPASADTTNHPHDAIVVSNKYCEYRIEDDNEAETTFYVTRKKKKKTKSKSRNASLNASGAN